LFGCFDAFCDDGEAECVAHFDCGNDNDVVFAACPIPFDQRSVEFDDVEREAAEVAEGGVAGAEIVER
jgi:hypothetical protein